MMEAGVVLDLKGEPIYWHTPNNRSGGALPDSQDLWTVFWENRHNISGFAHSHPGYGQTGPSHTDITTFEAVEAGLGKRLDWFITSGDSLALVRWDNKLNIYITTDEMWQCGMSPDEVPDWLIKLRELSNYK